ncbi:MAG: hypothetical protein H0X31_09900 [Nostocaceae cyanobacterium]|nr:hypothetical protein [Nostocaceae cyanobacterium]
MLYRLILITVSFLALTSCSAKAELKAPLSLNTPHSTESPQLSTPELISTNREAITTRKNNEKTASTPSTKTLNIANLTKEQAESKGYKKSQKHLAANGGSYMKLVPTGESNSLGNPLYDLVLFENDQEVGRYKAESGRAHTQQRDRNRSGTEAPLPDGTHW